MTVTTIAGVTPLDAVTELAARDGLAAGLRSLLDPGRPVPTTATGLTLLPAGWPVPAGQVPATTLAHPLAAAEGLDLVRVTTAMPADAGHARGLVAVRAGLLGRMLDLAVAHLAGRQSDGTPLTGRQLVQASIADLATTLEVCRHGLAVPDPDPGWLHDRLDRADLDVAALFGAAGYLRGHPLRCLHVAALVRADWTPWTTGDDDDGEW